MATLLPFLKRYRLPIGIALCLMLVELTVELFLPLLLAKIIDDGIMRGDIPVILKWGTIMIAVSLFSFGAGVLNAFFASHISQSTGFAIRNELFTKIQSFSFAQLEKFPTATLITRLTNDITQVQQTVYLGLCILTRAPLRVVGGTVMAFIVHPKLGLFLVLTLPLLIVFLIWMKRKGASLFREVQGKLDAVNDVIRENLMAMRLIKLFVRRKHEAERFQQKNRDLMTRTVTVLRVMEVTIPVLLLVMNAAVIGILWFGTFEFQAGSAQIGEIVAIVNYTIRITSALTVFSLMITVLSRAQASTSRIADILEEDGTELTTTFTARTTMKEGMIEYEQVSFHYPNSEQMIVNRCTFTVKGGERVAILGATGSGKTTLIQLIPRLYEISGGRILIDGVDLRAMDLNDLRSQIGYVTQDVVLFSGSVKENIQWGKKEATMAEIITAAKDAQIHETIMKLPRQYETKIGQKGVKLSGGQKQRLAIARALIRKPRILLLDDSTSALDVKTEERLLHALSTYSCTTLMITQKLSTAREADSILLLENGQIVAQGTDEELLQHSPLYRQIYESQYIEEDIAHAE